MRSMYVHRRHTCDCCLLVSELNRQARLRSRAVIPAAGRLPFAPSPPSRRCPPHGFSPCRLLATYSLTLEASPTTFRQCRVMPCHLLVNGLASSTGHVSFAGCCASLAAYVTTYVHGAAIQRALRAPAPFRRCGAPGQPPPSSGVAQSLMHAGGLSDDPSFVIGWLPPGQGPRLTYWPC